MHVSYESGILEDPALTPPEGIYKMTVEPEKASDTKEEIVISFKQGRCSEPIPAITIYRAAMVIYGHCVSLYQIAYRYVRRSVYRSLPLCWL